MEVKSDDAVLERVPLERVPLDTVPLPNESSSVRIRSRTQPVQMADASVSLPTSGPASDETLVRLDELVSDDALSAGKMLSKETLPEATP